MRSTKKLVKANELTHSQLGQIQQLYLNAFHSGEHDHRLDRCDSAIANTRLWYAAVSEFLATRALDRKGFNDSCENANDSDKGDSSVS